MKKWYVNEGTAKVRCIAEIDCLEVRRFVHYALTITLVYEEPDGNHELFQRTFYYLKKSDAIRKRDSYGCEWQKVANGEEALWKVMGL